MMNLFFKDGTKITLDKDYPVEDGIVNCLPDYLRFETRPSDEARNFIDIHNEVMKRNRGGEHLLMDKVEMARLQKDFYDSAALLYQKMDDWDKGSGGIHWMRINRNFAYDIKMLKGKNLLYIGAGNCRLSIMFAEYGFNVLSTDIAKNILRVGKTIADKKGIDMIYMAQNAEQPLPFSDNTFDSIFSNCTVNHITDWRTYYTEKIRVVKPGGVILERMPNGKLEWFWNQQTVLNDAVEIKAKLCHRESVNAFLKDIPNITYDVWTQDRLYNITPKALPFRLWQQYSKESFAPVMSAIYRLRRIPEDMNTPRDDRGIYTLAKIIKKR